jgi:hypothetical protein
MYGFTVMELNLTGKISTLLGDLVIRVPNLPSLGQSDVWLVKI